MKKLFVCLISVLLVAACNNKKESQQPQPEPQPAQIAVGIGKVIPQGGVSNLAAPVSGIVADILVEVGSRVSENDDLIILDNTDAKLSVNEDNARIATQQRNIRSARLLEEKGRITLQDKERKLSDAKELFAAGAISGENLRQLQNDYDVELQNQQKLRNDIALQQSQLSELAAQRNVSSENLRSTVLKAPMNGTVLSILPRKGEALNQYETYILLAPEAPLVVLAEIDEMLSSRIAVGQECEIKVLGGVGQTARGKILRVSPDLKKKSLFSDSGQDMEDRRVREIEVSIDNASDDLLIDTKVECIVHLN